MVAKYHLLRENGGEEGLALALAGGKVQRAELEMNELPDSILDRCYMSRQYKGSLRKILGLSTDKLEKIEADHAAKMAEALKAKNVRRD